MQDLLSLILDAGKSAVELTLYVLLPVMVVMMALMRLLEAKGVLAFVSRLLAPALRPFGLPGIGVFAMLQLLLVSFAAPAATLSVMEKQRIPQRQIAATLAMILAMSQANVVFPLLTVGLKLPFTLFTSLFGGFAAAAATYHLFLRTEEPAAPPAPVVAETKPRPRTRTWKLLVDGGTKGMWLSLQSLPAVVLALVLVKGLAALGAIALLERGLTPALERIGLSGIAVLPFATKYLAGGTAMTGVVLDLVKQGTLSVHDLNRIAGFTINPLDLVGVSFLLSSRPRVAAVARPAIWGALVGIAIRGVLHLIFG